MANKLFFGKASTTPDKGLGASSLVHPRRSSRKATGGQLEAGVAGGSRIWLLGHSSFAQNPKD